MRLLKSPAFYLVGSNLVFWGLPLLLIQLKSHSVADVPPPSSPAATVVVPVVSEPEIEPMPASVVAARVPEQRRPEAVPSPPSVASSMQPMPEQQPLNLIKELKGAAGLGGPITLESLKEPLMPVAARVERQQQKRSGDTLAALPRHWRDSLRQDLPAAKQVSEAMVVRLPVPALKRRQEVPVIVNEQGEGEALVAPQDPRVRQAVEGWAARQMAASPGTVEVYVVAAEPLEGDAL